MRERLLADHDVEARVRERHVERIAEPEVDQMVEPDQPGQAHRALVPARRDVEPGHPAAAVMGEIARRPAHAAADVEDVHAGADAGLVGQHVDRLEPAEVVLVVVLQHGLGQPVERHAVARQIVQDLLLVDRMGLVEVDDRSDAASPLGHGALTRAAGSRRCAR